jgi:hypothetical protein
MERGRSPDWGKKGKWDLAEYRSWLLHERDGVSFQKIGNALFPKDADPENRKMKAYRAYDRVESEFGRGHLKKRNQPAEFWISAFGVIPKMRD